MRNSDAFIASSPTVTNKRLRAARLLSTHQQTLGLQMFICNSRRAARHHAGRAWYE